MKPAALALLLLPFAAVQANTLYKCRGEDGHVTYTNQKGTGKNCDVLSRDQNVSTVGGGGGSKAASRTPTPGDFPKVDGDTQKGRDNDRRKILEGEVSNEQRSLDDARKSLEVEAGKGGSLERLQPFRDKVALHERNLEALRKELANLK
ncbi:MAG: DUF4124 domain-containing protein [Rhodocyclaceae bacterium]|nr:DUF4124 domain-containing protein [Rhodocyclaceae bacterium]